MAGAAGAGGARNGLIFVLRLVFVLRPLVDALAGDGFGERLGSKELSVVDTLLPLLLLSQMIYLVIPPITSHHEVSRGDWDLKIATDNGLVGVFTHGPTAVQKRSAVAGRDRRVELYIEAYGKDEHTVAT